MAETIELIGLKELDEKLAAMPQKLGFKALRKANALATGIKGRDAGATAAAMSRFVKKETANRTTLYVGPKSKHRKALAIYNAFHGTDAKRLRHFHLVEFGSVHGPAQPFLRPAFEATKLVVARSFGAKLKESIEKVAASA